MLFGEIKISRFSVLGNYKSKTLFVLGKNTGYIYFLLFFLSILLCYSVLTFILTHEIYLDYLSL
jgi:hypothetical protein